MKLTFAPRGVIQVEEARLIFNNFAGRGSMYNREGDRNFCLRIPTQEMADELINEGFNVKIKDPREEGEEPFIYLKVNVKIHPHGHEFERLNPQAYLVTNGRKVELDGDSIGMIDDIDILKVDLQFTGSDWTVNGRSGRSAYLKKIYVTQNIDDLDARYAEEEFPCEY